MGALVKVLVNACNEELDNIAESIYGEMKGVVGGHTRSGQAYSAIHKEVTGEWSRFVGGSHSHLYWLNEGNGTGRIYPKNAKALYLKDYGISRASVKTYEGIHFVEEIASHY